MRQVTDYSGVPSRAGLKLIKDRLLWLVRRMIHDASHLRRMIAVPKVDGQPACCTSMSSKMAALTCHAPHPQDGLAVKPLAVPVLDVVPRFAGNQVQEKPRKFCGCGGARIEGLLDSLPRNCPPVSVINERPITRSWIASVHRCLKARFGVEQFGEAGGVATLNRQFGIGRNSILRLVECPSFGRALCEPSKGWNDAPVLG